MHTKMRSKIRRRNNSEFARKFVTVGVMVSSVMVFVSVFVAVYFNSEAVAKRTFEKMAKEYYEEYYYAKFVETIAPELFEEKMEMFETTGIQTVPLRQLLLYQNGKNSEYRKYFEGENYTCDKNSTTAKFYPVKPYGPENYRVEYKYTCYTE